MLTVGEILRSQRESKKITFQEIEKQTKIRLKFLQAIENNDWSFFSSKIYIAGIIKNYSDYLDLDAKKMLAFFRRDYEKKEDIGFKRRIESSYLSPETKKVVVAISVLIFLLFFSYFGYQLKNYLSPPTVTILTPKTTNFTTETTVKVTGQTDKDVMIIIYGDRIYQDNNGIFQYDFPLHDGKNELVIELTGANGKTATVKKDYYKTPPQ